MQAVGVLYTIVHVTLFYVTLLSQVNVATWLAKYFISTFIPGNSSLMIPEKRKLVNMSFCYNVKSNVGLHVVSGVICVR